MLFGRGDEQACIDALLVQARRGVSGALVVRGEPGIGKSALLRYAIDQAEGMTVLAATGVEAEAALPAGPGIQRSFARRVASLPRETQAALLLPAASQSGATDEVRRARHASGAATPSRPAPSNARHV